MTLGRLDLHGPQAWPDDLFEESAICGAAIAVSRLAFGFALHRSTGLEGRWVWLNVYLGWWAFEICLDVGRERVP